MKPKSKVIFLVWLESWVFSCQVGRIILFILFIKNSFIFYSFTSYFHPLITILLFFLHLCLWLEFYCLLHKLQSVSICRLQAQPPRHVKEQPFSQILSSVADKLTESAQTVEFQQIVPTYISPAGIKVVGCIGMMSMEFIYIYIHNTLHTLTFQSFFFFLFACILLFDWRKLQSKIDYFFFFF